MGTEDLNGIEGIGLKDYQLIVFSGKLKTVTRSMHVSYKTVPVTDGNIRKTIQIFYSEETKTAYIADFYYDKYKAQIDSIFISRAQEAVIDSDSQLDAIVNDITENGVQIDQLKALRQDRNYIDLLQPDIYEAVKKDQVANKQMAVYLDYSVEKNCGLLENYDIYSIYWILKNSIYGHKRITALKRNDIRICAYLLNKKQLNIGEWTYLTSILKDAKNDPLYYELLYSVSYIDYSFAENNFAEIYKRNKTEIVEGYLFKLHPDAFFDEMLEQMKNTQDRGERSRIAINILRYYPDKRSSFAKEVIKLNDDGLLLKMGKIASEENMPEVAKIITETIVQKRNLNNYQRIIICPNDGNRINCERTTTLKGKDGGVHIIPVFVCPICKRRYTVSPNWNDYEPIRVKSGFIINLLVDPLEISSNRPSVIIDPFRDNSILKKRIKSGNKNEFIKKKCVVYGNHEIVKKCEKCNDVKLVSGECMSSSNKPDSVKIKMCPSCGMIYIQHRYYRRHEDIFECGNKEVLKKMRQATPNIIEKQEKEQRKTVVNNSTVNAMTNVLPTKSVSDLYKDDTKKQKRVVSDINSIQIKDFVVRRDVFKCMHNDHRLVNVNAAIDLINKDGEIVHTTVSAGYCRECNTYFIMESTFQNLKNKGTPICRISDEKAYLKGVSSINGIKLASESLLMQYGYNVSQQEGLTTTRRHKILAVLIDNHIMTKSEILSYLDFFINQRQSQHKYEKAIEKWNIDKEFVDEYKAGRYTTIGVSGIYRR